MDEFPLDIVQIFAEVPYFEVTFVLGFTVRISAASNSTKLGYSRGIEVVLFLHICHYIFEGLIVS